MHDQIATRSRRVALEQRRQPTRSEDILWQSLRGRQLAGLKFRRQSPIGPYVADFVCFEARIIVELDGPPHEDQAQREHDVRRDAWLRQQGFRVLRFSNDLIVGGSGELVLEVVCQAAREVPSSDLR